MGNLTRDPELRQLPSGQAVCTLRLAVSRPYRTASGENREDTLFVDVVAWGRQAETSNTYLRKGSSIFVEGSLRLEQWQDKTTGQSRQRHSVTAERVQFLNTQQRSDGGYQQAAPQGLFSRSAQAALSQHQLLQLIWNLPLLFSQVRRFSKRRPVNPAPTAPAGFTQPPPPVQAAVPPAPVFDTDDLEDDIPF